VTATACLHGQDDGDCRPSERAFATTAPVPRWDLGAVRGHRPANVSALTCGRNGNGGDDDVDAPKRAAGAKRSGCEGRQVASAPVRRQLARLDGRRYSLCMRARVLPPVLLAVAVACACNTDHRAAVRFDGGIRESLEAARPVPTSTEDTGIARSPMDASTGTAWNVANAPTCSDRGSADATVPPSDCVPPCLWDLVRTCPQPVAHVRTSGPFPESYRATDYSGADGCYCLGISSSGVPPVTFSTDWFDAGGRHVAGAFFQTTGSPTLGITCVSMDRDAGLVQGLDPSLYLPPLAKDLVGGTTYDVAWRDSKCARWRWLY
jgi:hypothetical protein